MIPKIMEKNLFYGGLWFLDSARWELGLAEQVCAEARMKATTLPDTLEDDSSTAMNSTEFNSYHLESLVSLVAVVRVYH